MPTKFLIVLVLALNALNAASAMAQSALPGSVTPPVDPAPPASYSTQGLIAIEMPIHNTLKYGVDPATLAIVSFEELRYVMVAQSPSGSINALFEGLRCTTGEVKTYARSSQPGQWHVVQEPKWRLIDNNQATKHALMLGRQGVCEGGSLSARTVPELVQYLRNPQLKRGY